MKKIDWINLLFVAAFSPLIIAGITFSLHFIISFIDSYILMPLIRIIVTTFAF